MSLIIAGTGHRPDKLGGYSAQVSVRLFDLAVATLKHYKPDKIISGGALGWDTAIAMASIELNIPLVLATPFKGQEVKWYFQDKLKYKRILKLADAVVTVSQGGYSAKKMQIRNQWMVDNSNVILALWDGSKGGTANCVNYAQKRNVKIINVWNSWVRYKGF